MGCSCMKQSRKVHENEVALAAQTCFTVDDIKALHDLFRKLSSSIKDDGFISKEEFLIGLFRSSSEHSLFADRMFSLFDSKNDGLIDFAEFIRTLSIFHPDGPEADKVSFAFRLYDVRENGFIGREEVKGLVLAFLSESELMILDDAVEAIVKKTFEDADSKQDGKIDVEEWKRFTAQHPSVLKNMTVPYLKDVRRTFPSFLLKPEVKDQINHMQLEI